MIPGAGTDERRFRRAGRKPVKGSFGNFKVMIFVAVIFYALAVIFWLISHSIFYLFNFTFIGTAAALGMGLWPVLAKDKKHIARKLSQALVGGYMFFGLGIGLVYIGFGRLEPENMQLAGFWFLLLGGSFAAAVMHYTIAKIIGPFLFGRGWCGWACWTAAVLDFLPWRRSPGRLPKKFGAVKYIVFAVVTTAVFLLVFVFGYTRRSLSGFVDLTGTRAGPGLSPSLFQIPEFWWFAIGNAVYYVIAIILAAVLKDNRAFCKYLCPVTIFLKAGSRFSLVKIKGNAEACTDCKLCEKNCPMDITITEFVANGKRVTSSECIFCQTCVTSCAQGALRVSFGFDGGFRDRLKSRIR
jgi:ferredoxin-type protein NapH